MDDLVRQPLGELTRPPPGDIPEGRGGEASDPLREGFAVGHDLHRVLGIEVAVDREDARRQQRPPLLGQRSAGPTVDDDPAGRGARERDPELSARQSIRAGPHRGADGATRDGIEHDPRSVGSGDDDSHT